MSIDFDKVDKQRLEDETVETALRHFRESVHAWSEQEFARPRSVKSTRWQRFFRVVTRPVFSGAMAGVLLMAGAGVPLAVHHERVVAVKKAEETAKLEEARLRLEETQRQAGLAMNDEELMSHVDSDIAQAAPDAMEPLASLMSDSGPK